uniref:Uncharacterized protein n=1 Tax=Anguilla anguilla TaxID=7936 RepID=A0A0E9UIA2_ANGAN
MKVSANHKVGSHPKTNCGHVTSPSLHPHFMVSE